MKTARTGRCPGCGTPTVTVPDQETRELVVLDETRVDGGTVQILAVGPIVACRQLGRPALLQPAHQRHRCSWTDQQDIYTDVDRDNPGLEQAGWRAP